MRSILLVGLMTLPLTACSISEIDRAINNKATDSALCSELELPFNLAVDTTLKYADQTPTEVIDAWAKVTRGFDAGCS